MASLVKGQKVPLNAESSPAMNISFGVAGKFDVLALLLDHNGKLPALNLSFTKTTGLQRDLLYSCKGIRNSGSDGLRFLPILKKSCWRL